VNSFALVAHRLPAWTGTEALDVDSALSVFELRGKEPVLQGFPMARLVFLDEAARGL
jgi:hypothetical protein